MLTINENFLSGRPLGSVMDYLALKYGKRSWLRAKCIAKECESLEIKKRC